MQRLIHPWFRPGEAKGWRWVEARWILVIVGVVLINVGSEVLAWIGSAVLAIALVWLVGGAIARTAGGRRKE